MEFLILNLYFDQHFISIDYVGHFLFSQLLPLLASALEFGSAAAPALTALLKMGSWLSVEEFRVKVNNNFSTFIIYLSNQDSSHACV